MVKGTDKGTITSLDGTFSLTLEENENTIVVSFVGYKTKEVSINNVSKISIFLEEDITELGEVVVTALGFKEERDKLGQTASKVEGNQMVQDDFQLICWDFVSEPSTPGAFMMNEGKEVSESDLNEYFNKSDRIDRVFNDILSWEEE